MQHAQREGRHACMPRLRPGHQTRQQHARAVQDLLGGVGAGEEFQPALKGGRQFQPLPRVGLQAQSAVEVVEQTGTEAPRQAGARQRAQVGQCVQTHALQRVPVFTRRAGRSAGPAQGASTPRGGPGLPRPGGQDHPHGRFGEQGLQRRQARGVRTQHQVAPAARIPLRQQRRAQRGGCGRHLHAVTQRHQRGLQALLQCGQATEKAQAALNFQQDGLRIVRRDGRREGKRRVRHGLQRCGFAAGVAVADQQVGRQRQRGGAFNARFQAALRRLGVELADAVACQQGHRAFGVGCRQRGAEGFQRQQRQVQGDPEHG